MGSLMVGANTNGDIAGGGESRRRGAGKCLVLFDGDTAPYLPGCNNVNFQLAGKGRGRVVISLAGGDVAAGKDVE